MRLNFSVRNGKRWDPHAITTLISLVSDLSDLSLGFLAGFRLPVVTEKDHRWERSADKARQDSKREPRRTASAYRPFVSFLLTPSPYESGGTESFRVISTARLRTLPPLHLPPIYVVVCNDPHGDLILRLASRLDAFSAYPYPTRLPGSAPGGTTGAPEVGPTRSSRTGVRATQISSAHNR